MKIRGIEATAVLIPAVEPLADTLDPVASGRPAIAISLLTDQGIDGVGMTYFGAALTPALLTIVKLLGEMIVGMDPLDHAAIGVRLRGATGSAGPTGLHALAFAAIDIALWDIRGKLCGLPLWKMLGGSGQPVSAYASGALRRTLPLGVLEEAAGKLVAKGFTDMKMQLGLLGDATAADELERVETVRRVIGTQCRLMADINQRWRPDQAIAIGRALDPRGLAWLEDVTAHDDIAGQARVTAALATPIAAGELIYGLRGFRNLIAADAVDIVMIDLFRAGGITQWLKIAALAEAFNLPVVSHLAPEIHGQLIGSIPNGLTVEFMPWFAVLFEQSPWPENGLLAMPEGPGLGLAWDRAALTRFAMT